jgi:hypothetical protein
MDTTTTITNTMPLLYIGLPSGNTAAFVYVATAGDLMIGMLLVALVFLQVMQLWKRV